MDPRLSEAVGIINVVKALDESSFQFSKHQCMRLVEYYSKVGEFFEHIMEVREDVPVNLAMVSLDATVSVLQKGQVLLTKCTTDDWQTSLVTEGLNQGSFEALHLELEACVQSIHEFLEENVPGIMHYRFMKVRFFSSLVPFLSLKNMDFKAILQEDAEKDRVDMLAKIESAQMETMSVRCLSVKEKSSQLQSLDTVSEALEKRPAGIRAYLPSVQWIKASEIELLEVIGSGGNAVVRKCRYSGREYAVKILDTKVVDFIKDEVEILRNLQHPNIVPLVGCSVGSSETNPMIVMELLDGDLRLLLRRHPLSWSKVVDVMHNIATGMAYLHRQGIFHGDLKSKNVLVRDVDGRCEVKITDFGVSQLIPRPSRPTVVNTDIDSRVSQQIPGPTVINPDTDFGVSWEIPWPTEVNADIDFGDPQQTPWPTEVNADNDFGVSQEIPGPFEINADNDLDFEFHSEETSLSDYLYPVEIPASDYLYTTETSSGNGDSVNSRSFSGPVGTPMWMAPEVLTSSGAGNNLYSAKADVYSFAMLCVELITGEDPYHVQHTRGNIRDHVVVQGNRPRLPEDLPSDLRELIVECWDEEPYRRPAFPEICSRLQKLKVHSPRLQQGLQKLSWRSKVLHSSRFRAAMVLMLALMIYWTSVNQEMRREVDVKD